ncbi:MAG: Ig-like domain repeat protein, partial [Acidobacteriaceae bacterium]
MLFRGFAKFAVRLVLAVTMVALLCPQPSHAAAAPSIYGPGTIQGIALDADGDPAVSATVVLSGNTQAIERTATVDQNGGFFFFGVPTGSYSIVLDAGSRGNMESDFIFQQGPVAGMTITLQLMVQDAETSGASDAGLFRIRATNPTMAGRPALTATQLPRMSAQPSAQTTAQAAALTTTPTAANPAANFTIYAAPVAPNPVNFGFNISPAEWVGTSDNHYFNGEGMTPWDARQALTATQGGSDTTFICNDPGVGTDFFGSIASGYFVGALARVYRFTGGVWTLVRTGTISAYTAVYGSTNPADHTITFSTSGPTTQQGDVIWMSLDANQQPPNFNMLSPRLQKYGHYNVLWNTEKAQGPTTANPYAAYTYDTDVPPAYNNNGPSVPGLSLKLTDTNKETQGIWQYIQPLFYGTYDGFETGHTYEFSVWLKQSGVADGSVTVSFGRLGLTHTFTGVTSSWQQFTWNISPVPNVLSGGVPSIHLDFNAPGTVWYDNVQLWDSTNGRLPDTWDPRQLAALQNFHPGTMRIWSNFSSSSGSYQFWSLSSWLADEEDGRSNSGIGNINETTTTLEHLPTALAYAKQIGADPWIIVSMSLSEQEWSDLIDYLAAPTGIGYAANRPANHPGPYTADFNTIYVEFGNEEWGTQSTPVNGDYGQWMHYMLSQAIAGKSYFDPAQIKFIGNSFTKLPSFASTAARSAPEVSVFDYYNYVSGNTTLTGDAYYQSDLLQLPETNQALINNIVSTQQADAYAGHPYQVFAYEGGPGSDTTSHQGDTSLAAGVMTLDVDLYSSQMGFGAQNFFLYSLYNPAHPSPYTSHSDFTLGLVPHPAWEALQMRNQYAHGPMVLVGVNADPLSPVDGTSPLIGVYAFHDTTGGSDVAEVFVLSRDLNNITPVTLNFPGVPTGTAMLYTLTGDPRSNNDAGLLVPIASSPVTVTQSYTFNMPPGSVYLFVVPTGAWSTVQPPPLTPTSLTAEPGASEVSLSWAPVATTTHYNVKRSLTSGGPYTTIASPTYVAYKDTTVTNGTTYYYVVTAVNAGGESPNSNEVSATPNVAVAQYTATPPPMDGTSTSPVWSTATTYIYQHKNEGNTPDTGTFKLLWDANNLYMLATIMDSTPVQSTSIWNGDSVEMYIDGNDSKPTTYGANDFQYAFPWNGTAVTESKHNATYGVTFGQINIPGGYQMTMALPWSTLLVPSPTAGSMIGFDTMVNDGDPVNVLRGKIAWWATTNNSWSDPALFGNVMLAGGPGSNSTSTILVASPTSAVYGTSVTLTATVSSSGGTPTGTVNFYDGATLLGTGTLNSSGVATLTVTALPVGSDNLTASYVANGSFAASTSSATVVTINSVETTTTSLSASPTNSTYGATVTLAATVSGSGGTPTGTVNFYDGATLLGTGVLNSSGVATISTTTLPVGSNSVTASYAANGSFAASTSSAVTVTVTAAATTTALSASPTSAVYGASVTLTATVASSGGTPTGVVTFYNGATSLGTGTLNASGVATLTVAALPVGSDSLTA